MDESRSARQCRGCAAAGRDDDYAVHRVHRGEWVLQDELHGGGIVTPAALAERHLLAVEQKLSAVGTTMRASMRASTDLPDPLSPTTDVTLPRRQRRSRRRRRRAAGAAATVAARREQRSAWSVCVPRVQASPDEGTASGPAWVSAACGSGRRRERAVHESPPNHAATGSRRDSSAGTGTPAACSQHATCGRPAEATSGGSSVAHRSMA